MLGMLILLPLDLAGQGWAWGPVTQEEVGETERAES